MKLKVGDIYYYIRHFYNSNIGDWQMRTNKARVGKRYDEEMAFEIKNEDGVWEFDLHLTSEEMHKSKEYVDKQIKLIKEKEEREDRKRKEQFQQDIREEQFLKHKFVIKAQKVIDKFKKNKFNENVLNKTIDIYYHKTYKVKGLYKKLVYLKGFSGVWLLKTFDFVLKKHYDENSYERISIKELINRINSKSLNLKYDIFYLDYASVKAMIELIQYNIKEWKNVQKNEEIQINHLRLL